MNAEPLTWVIGAGGLLGSHLTGALSRLTPLVHIWQPPNPKFRWEDAGAVADEFEGAIAHFTIKAASYRKWLIFWAAGRGVVSSSEKDLAAEAKSWRLFLDLLAKYIRPLVGRTAGTIFLASSAGGVYGGNPDTPCNEKSDPRPISPYGQSKLEQERVLKEWAREQTGISYLLGRISNLYGSSQSPAKAKGLIAYISRCLIHNTPLHLYVPLHTIRDYLPVDTCADQIIACMRYLSAQTQPGCESQGFIKVLASEQETSLAQIIATFARISHRHPKLICAPNPAAELQPNRLQFRSLLWRHLDTQAVSSLQADIKRFHEHQFALYLKGQLPPPA